MPELDSKSEPGVDNRAAIQLAVDRCAAAGGGRVIVPQGTCVSGEILLKSHVCPYLESGAVLRASADPAAYPTRYRLFDLRAFISAVDAECVTIADEGTLDGDCHAWVDHEGAYYLYKREKDRLPFLVQFVHCRHVVLRDITIRNGPVWTVVPRGCDDVLISGVSIYNDLRMLNSDAIDIVSCRDVRIVGCHIEAAEVTLRNCRVTFTDAARESGEFRHVVAHDHAPGLRIEGLTGEAALPGLPPVAPMRIRAPAERDDGLAADTGGA